MKKPKKIVAIAISTVIAIVLVLGGLYLIGELKAKSDEAKTPQINRYSTIDDIDFNSDKVNIYVFWGKGCEHCEDLYQYLSEIWDEYSPYFNLYSFEIWNSTDNQKIMDYFMGELGEPTGTISTPTFIIGDELFQGFRESDKEKIKQTIKDKQANLDSIHDFSGVKELDLANWTIT